MHTRWRFSNINSFNRPIRSFRFQVNVTEKTLFSLCVAVDDCLSVHLLHFVFRTEDFLILDCRVRWHSVTGWNPVHGRRGTFFSDSFYSVNENVTVVYEFNKKKNADHCRRSAKRANCSRALLHRSHAYIMNAWPSFDNGSLFASFRDPQSRLASIGDAHKCIGASVDVKSSTSLHAGTKQSPSLERHLDVSRCGLQSRKARFNYPEGGCSSNFALFE